MEQLNAPLRTWELIVERRFYRISRWRPILLAAQCSSGVRIRCLAVAVQPASWGPWALALISTIADTQILAFQAGLIASMLPAILLSGFIFQIRVMPWPLQLITYVVPARYFLVILRGIILKGEGIATYWPQVGGLVLFGLAMVTLASLRLARREA
jgi:hypothetical protein